LLCARLRTDERARERDLALLAAAERADLRTINRVGD
jgi:hypothetical protein